MVRFSKLIMDVGSAFVGNRQFELNSEALSSNLYPLDLEFTLVNEPRYYTPKDASGVPMWQYKSVGLQYNQTRISAYALAHYNRYAKTKNKDSRDLFLRMADWFMQEEDALWRYYFDWHGLKAPWISCMAQGEGISVLTRAYKLTQDERYLAQAKRAARPFSLPIPQGGVRSKIAGQWDFLEEYPLQRPSNTLNGFMYALIGILDLGELDPEAKADTGFSELVATLEAEWQRWDLSYWSAYDLHVSKRGRRNPATVSYHKLHMTLLRYLAEKLDLAGLAACYDRWTRYYHSPINRVRALASKVAYRLEEPAPRI